jgi:hypothetical protein
LKQDDTEYADTGSAARFFYCAKSSRAERDHGLDNYEIVMVQLSHDNQTTEKDGESWENADQSLQLLVDTEQSCAKAIGVSMTMGDAAWSTLLCGKGIMDLSPKDIIFTTKTGTNSITGSRTFNWLMRLLINASMAGVRFETVSGGNRARNAAKCNLSLSFTNGKPAFLPGVGNVASGTRWKISASEERANENKPGQLCNFHSTVKPIALMRYLVRLTKTPTGGTVLDPFMGSGSTGVACVLEGRDFVGIEQDANSFDIAKARIEAAQREAQQLEMELSHG